MKINVCLACDNNYAKYAGVLIASILKNAKDDEDLAIYILNGGIQDEEKHNMLSLKNIKNCEINFLDIDESLYEDYRQIKTHNYLPLSSFYRLKMGSLLSNVDRIIYFDCDMIVNNSLAELFNADLEGNIIGGVQDINKRMLAKNPSYINSGMVLFDLDAVRKNNIEDKFLSWTKENIEIINMGDQQIINEVLHGKIKLLDERWNVQSSNFTNRSSYTRTPYVIHFVSKKKPWHFGSFSYHKKYYFKYLQETPWRLQEEEKFYWYTQNQLASLFGYVLYRPFFLFRPRFYKALFYTYIK